MKTLKVCKMAASALPAVVYLLGPGAGAAHAYIDPGTGSSLLSTLAIMVGVLSAGVAVFFGQAKRWGLWLVDRLAARRNGKQDAEEAVEE